MPLETPTVTVADNADGTGAVATVADSNASATNTVYYISIGDELTPATFTSGGSRVGNGTVALSITTMGQYWVYVSSTLSGETTVSDLVFLSVTSGSNAIWYDCLTAVKSTINSLSLTGLAAKDIRVQKVPWQRSQVMPGMFVTPVTETSNPKDGTNYRDDIGYGCQVVCVRLGNREMTANFNTHLYWRERVRKAFLNQRLAGVSESLWCSVQPGAVVLPSAFEDNYDVWSLIIRAICRETRGTAG